LKKLRYFVNIGGIRRVKMILEGTPGGRRIKEEVKVNEFC